MALITQAVNSKGVLKLKMSKAFNRVVSLQREHFWGCKKNLV